MKESGSAADDAAGVVAGGAAAERVAEPGDTFVSARCGGCQAVTERRRRDGTLLVLVPYVICMSCDGIRCAACWDELDLCPGGDEHEFGDVVDSTPA